MPGAAGAHAVPQRAGRFQAVSFHDSSGGGGGGLLWFRGLWIHD